MSSTSRRTWLIRWRWPREVRHSGHRHVDALLRDRAVELRPLELLLARRDSLFDRLAGGVQRHAGLAVAHLAQGELQRALPAEVVHPHVVERSGRRGGGDGGERFLSEGLGLHGGDCTRFPSSIAP